MSVSQNLVRKDRKLQCSQNFGGIPKDFKLVKDTKLPDPFLFTDGTQVQSSDDWECRQQQIKELILRYELGYLPPKPDSLTANLTATTIKYGNLTIPTHNLNINATNGGTTISFSASIQYPASGQGPYPAVIAYGGPSIHVPPSVATIFLDNDLIAQQNSNASRGIGLFYDLYGVNATASAMTAWAVSRIIDALETMPEANINTTRLAVTGCSRNGKGALVAGALDERITLTIPQESGSGGDACWRLSDAEQAAGYVVQTSTEIVRENVWFSLTVDEFAPHNTSWLPFDHHMLAGLIAPRALLAIENTAYVWLSPQSSYGCMTAAHKIWEALGVPQNMGFTQDGNHSHCAFPAEQQPELTAFFERFLLDEMVDTTVFKTTNETFNETEWIDWEVPKLSS
ncbi:carbohydrate esterase family 15 protein [Hyaloscypha variabilis F]|uniref:(4-O-methyl)-D-glucuronate--lignin esterase n=1 Tax=Hyaloscypha variabilis (strain UAMH 11265 / GT02V1 / F) TaxID=1149755 RepID=A0A2J6QS61_HYAVF|nr:carbohydrate esterase family 15 protein [Hyaloscypha variabilis F]